MHMDCHMLNLAFGSPTGCVENAVAQGKIQQVAAYAQAALSTQAETAGRNHQKTKCLVVTIDQIAVRTPPPLKTST